MRISCISNVSFAGTDRYKKTNNFPKLQKQLVKKGVNVTEDGDIFQVDYDDREKMNVWKILKSFGVNTEKQFPKMKSAPLEKEVQQAKNTTSTQNTVKHKKLKKVHPFYRERYGNGVISPEVVAQKLNMIKEDDEKVIGVSLNTLNSVLYNNNAEQKQPRISAIVKIHDNLDDIHYIKTKSTAAYFSYGDWAGKNSRFNCTAEEVLNNRILHPPTLIVEHEPDEINIRLKGKVMSNLLHTLGYRTYPFIVSNEDYQFLKNSEELSPIIVTEFNEED